MADNLTNVAETNTLKWLLGQATTAPTGAFKLALLTANGTDAAAGTEVVGGSYLRQTITFGAVVNGSASNDAVVRFDGMPAVTVVGVEVYDSAVTPVRWWQGALQVSKTIAAGEPAEFAVGDFTVSIG